MSTATQKPAKLPVTVDKPTPYTFDLGLLLSNDPNPVSVPPTTATTTTDRTALETHLTSVARDGAQVLINQLLTACPITSHREGVLLALPPPQTPLPREKPVPAPKPETKWSAFAKRRGIKPKTREQRRNQQYNEATGEFERKWGYKGANKAGQDDAVIEEGLFRWIIYVSAGSVGDRGLGGLYGCFFEAYDLGCDLMAFAGVGWFRVREGSEKARLGGSPR
ncbi:RRS1-domain-containing protein [Parathielavia hyrcaniae]|uniref:Ribosome biogenesis regulatory protein n=1 Tax=Parathielavia hyrcaniae TaxID=113614 RepID=A0AAN6Q963_9PEZI|nr:RRS1-domain-containing protein [Parathielavia hyrcaniae]